MEKSREAARKKEQVRQQQIAQARRRAEAGSPVTAAEREAQRQRQIEHLMLLISSSLKGITEIVRFLQTRTNCKLMTMVIKT